MPPGFQGGAQPNAALQTTVMNMQQMINTSSNTFQAQQGNANGLQSGIAGAQQIEQGNIGSIKWFAALQIAVCHTARILIDAIPRVYDATRQVRILEEDGTANIVTLNTTMIDRQTQELVEINNLAKGKYDVVCDYGPAFNSQQKETVQAFLDMATIDPTFLEQGKDIMLKNLSAPGMDQMAERSREQLLNAGLIPESQLTDEERQKIAEAQALAAQKPPQEDPMMVAARAEEGKAQAELQNAANKQAEIQASNQIKMLELQLKNKQIDLDTQKFIKGQDDRFNVDAAKITQGQQKLDQEQQKIDISAQEKQTQALMQMQKQIVDTLSAQAQTLKTLREAMGVDAVVGPANTEAYKEQADIVLDSQDNQAS